MARRPEVGEAAPDTAGPAGFAGAGATVRGISPQDPACAS